MTAPRYYGQWSPPVDEVLARNYFPDLGDGILLECGAGDGLADSCGRHFEERGWRCFNHEPNKDLFAQLLQNRPLAVNLSVVLGANSQMTSYRAVYLAEGPTVGGGTDMPQPWLDAMIARGLRIGEPEQVRIVAYWDLYSGLDVDLLILDVEGHELQVIEGMREASPLPRVVCVEYPISGLVALRTALESLGYRYDFVSHNNAFFARPQVAMPPGWGVTPIWCGLTADA